MRATQNALKHGDARPGQVKRLHNIWRGIAKRCNPNLASPNPKYAGRGIRMCEQWSSYVVFREWAQAHGYSDELTIERIDNDGHYEPGNCRWVTGAEQAKNRRNTKLVEHDGRSMCLEDWAREASIDQSLLSWRLSSGWSVERALTTPPMKKPGRPKSTPHFQLA